MATFKTPEILDRKRAGLVMLAQGIGSDLASEAKSRASWTDRTGNTRRAIHGGGERRPNGAAIYVAHGSMIGTYLEEGTPPHIIRPKNAKALRFNVGGKTIFAKQVNHPGTRPYPTIGPTVERNWPDIKAQVRRYWEST